MKGDCITVQFDKRVSTEEEVNQINEGLRNAPEQIILMEAVHIIDYFYISSNIQELLHTQL